MCIISLRRNMQSYKTLVLVNEFIDSILRFGIYHLLLNRLFTRCYIVYFYCVFLNKNLSVVYYNIEIFYYQQLLYNLKHL